MKNNWKEIWKPIKDYEGLYEVSNFGVVRSLDRTLIVNRLGKKVHRKIKGTNLKTTKTTGYHIVSLCKNSVLKTGLLHRIIAEAFIPNPKGKPQVNHIDNNRRNNIVSNLEWVTRSENIQHAVKQNRMMNGERIWQAKLTEDDVREIRTSKLPYKKLENIYNIKGRQIYRIKKRIQWKHVI